MGLQPDLKVAAEFKALIDDASRTENHLQAFLEKHSEFVSPEWQMNHRVSMNALIAKFPVGTRTADFAYLTSSSAKWYLVLVELESAQKRLFTESSSHSKTSADFDDALHQTHVWAEFFDEHYQQVRESLRPILIPPAKARNSVELRRMLVIGRSAELEVSEQRRKRIATIEEAHKIRILTYDTLLRYYLSGQGHKRCILSPRGAGFAIKRMDAVPTNAFAYIGPEHLHVPAKFDAELVTNGYQMDHWRAGRPLMFHDKWAVRPTG